MMNGNLCWFGDGKVRTRSKNMNIYILLTSAIRTNYVPFGWGKCRCDGKRRKNA
jgi:hypothetical protein